MGTVRSACAHACVWGAKKRERRGTARARATAHALEAELAQVRAVVVARGTLEERVSANVHKRRARMHTHENGEQVPRGGLSANHATRPKRTHGQRRLVKRCIINGGGGFSAPLRAATSGGALSCRASSQEARRNIRSPLRQDQLPLQLCTHTPSLLTRTARRRPTLRTASGCGRLTRSRQQQPTTTTTPTRHICRRSLLQFARTDRCAARTS